MNHSYNGLFLKVLSRANFLVAMSFSSHTLELVGKMGGGVHRQLDVSDALGAPRDWVREQFAVPHADLKHVTWHIDTPN